MLLIPLTTTILGYPLKDVLGFTVLAAIVTVAGNLIATFIKDFLFVRHFEKRREKRESQKIYRKYKDPIILSAIELIYRLSQIFEGYRILEHLTDKERKEAENNPIAYMSLTSLDTNADYSKNDASDPHYKQYKFKSTLYRIGAFFGWLELYRQDLTFLESNSEQINTKLKGVVRKIRNAFADGELNTNENWQEYTDRLIFREEQRAIGDKMIVPFGTSRTVMGYAAFSDIVSEFHKSKTPEWLSSCFYFLADPSHKLDFRKERIKEILRHLFDLIDTLDKNSHDQELVEARKIITVPD